MLGVFFYFFNSDYLKKLKWILFITSVILLVLVFVPGIGFANYGARRWIKILGFSFQPSELAKFALILFCASTYSENYKKVKIFLVISTLLVFFCFQIDKIKYKYISRE